MTRRRGGIGLPGGAGPRGAGPGGGTGRRGGWSRGGRGATCSPSGPPAPRRQDGSGNAPRAAHPAEAPALTSHPSAAPPAPRPSLGARLYARPFLLLTLTALMWAANGVAARLAVGEVAPMTLVCLRWLGAGTLLAAVAGPDLRRDLPLLLPRWRWLLAMGLLGFTGFNALYYVAAFRTGAVNLTLLQASVPVMVLAGARAVYGTPVRAAQAVGAVMALAGVLLVVSGGDLDVLLHLKLNSGDAMVLVACVMYAAYALALRRRPAVSGLALFAALALSAFLWSLPLLAAEALRGEAAWPTPTGWAVLAFVALFPSLISQVFFIRGVELVGPGRAGLFVNLVPVFGALLAVALLGEPFGWHHAGAVALVIGGIALGERGAGRAEPGESPG